ncbi:phospholipase D-like domain-containing protein [uncultured Roseobacter sp.]|uniref:phospholipase D-like domain-containing protein n=1 Tax=uncultured Roseobacter sp. TaxID=114847 RepID=UPI0026154ECA|nr:phospholipase D-like domain-containing protein [uncultured Roseobacter sp.]
MAPLNDLKILITAAEAYSALEEAVLDAQTRIDAGFRVFDPRTPLQSERARRIGNTWVDLLVHKLDQGVQVSITLTDFDPVMRAGMHQGSWKSFSIFAGISEMSDNGGLLRAVVADHPARVGWGPRLMLRPAVQGQIAGTCQRLNAMAEEIHNEAWRCMPLFRELAVFQDGQLRPRRDVMVPMMPVSHHQKMAVIDDRVLYIGGLDLDQRRLDTPDHRGKSEQTWHDVQVILTDPARARSAREHLDHFLDECAGNRPVVSPPGLLRTLSVKRTRDAASLSPDVTDTGIMDRHLALIGRSEHLIYLESQFMRDPVIAEALAERAAQAPELGLVIILPGAPLEVAFEKDDSIDLQFGEFLQAKAVDMLRDSYGERLFVGSPAQPTDAGYDEQGRQLLHGAPIIFVHSKVSVFDDQAGLVSSANLNGRSMRWDTEMGIEISDPAQVRQLRQRVMGAWLPANANADMTCASVQTVEQWRQLAEINAATSPRSRQGFVLPYETEPARKMGLPIPGWPTEMV